MKRQIKRSRSLTFDIFVNGRGCHSKRISKMWWRVYIHPNREAMYDSYDKRFKRSEKRDYAAMTTCPGRWRGSGQIGELDFCREGLYSHRIIHELMHAVIDTLSYTKRRELIPPRWLAVGHFSMKDAKAMKTASEWGRRSEVAAHMIQYFYAHFERHCAKRKIQIL